MAAQYVVRLPGRHEVLGSNPCWCVTFLAEKILVLSGRLVWYFWVKGAPQYKIKPDTDRTLSWTVTDERLFLELGMSIEF